MDKKPNKDILIQIMLKNGLNRADIAKMCGRDEATIRSWLSVAKDDVPDHMLQLIKLKVGDGR